MRRARPRLAAAILCLGSLAAAPAGASVPAHCHGIALPGQACPDLVARYDHPDGHGLVAPEVVTDMALSPDGSTAYLTGRSPNAASGSDLAVVAIDTASGRVRWADRYDSGNPWDRDEQGVAIAVAPDGRRVFVTGIRDGFDGLGTEIISIAFADYVTLAYDAVTGARLWTAVEANPSSPEGGDAAERPYAIAVSGDGAMVAVTGFSWRYDHGAGIHTAVYDAATGERAWAARHDAGGQESGSFAEVGRALVFGEDRLYVAGWDTPTGPDKDILVLAYSLDLNDPGTVGAAGDAARVDWVSRVQASAGYEDGAFAATLSADGLALAVTGTSTALLDTASGEVHWAVTASPRGADVVMTDALVLVAGGEMMTTVAYERGSGAEVWRRAPHDDLAAVLGSSARSIALGPGGDRVYVTGEIQPRSPYALCSSLWGGCRNRPSGDAIVAAYRTSDGSELWTGRFNTSPVDADVLGGVAVAAAGDTVAVAASLERADPIDENFSDLLLLAYDATPG